MSDENRSDIEQITYLINNGFNISKLCYKVEDSLKLIIEFSQQEITKEMVIDSFSETFSHFINQFIKKPKFWGIGFWNAKIKVAGMEFIDIKNPKFTWNIILATVTTEFVFKIDLKYSHENKKFANVNVGENLKLLIYNGVVFVGKIVQIKKDDLNSDILEVFCKGKRKIKRNRI